MAAAQSNYKPPYSIYDESNTINTFCHRQISFFVNHYLILVVFSYLYVPTLLPFLINLYSKMYIPSNF